MAGRQVWNELVRTTAQLLTPLSSNPGGATTLWLSSVDGYLYFGTTPLTGPSAGAVDSVFGRAGDVVAQAGDYDFAELGATPTTLAGYGITDAATSAQGTLAETATQPDEVNTFTAGQIAEVTALVDGANISIDLEDSNNFSLTLGGNRQLDFPLPAPVPGQSGFITVTQDGVGGHALTYEAGYTFAGGAAPTLTVAAGAEDLLAYYVIDAAQVDIALAQADIS